MQLCGSLSSLWHCLSLGLEWKLTFSCGHCWVFQICWHIERSTFTASSFRIWNSSTGIPSPSLAVFVVMLPKAHLTSYSRMSGSRWVTTPLWLSGSWSFFYIVPLCILATSSVSVRSIPFLTFIVPIFVWKVPFVSLIFLKKSIVFPFLLFSSISLHWSLRKAFLLLLPILWTLHSDAYIFPFLLCLSLLFFSQPFVKPPQTTILLFCISFSLGWFWALPPVQCYILISWYILKIKQMRIICNESVYS